VLAVDEHFTIVANENKKETSLVTKFCNLQYSMRLFMLICALYNIFFIPI